jgi:hypothetical protein
MNRFEEASARFDVVHESDPEARAVAYHRNLAAWVERVSPGAPEAMRLAARCQHLRRWAIPRGDHPPGRAGYRAWRSALARLTADEAAGILADVGYDDATIARVRELVLKEGLRHDQEVQLFEDAICLSFLEHDLEPFADKHDDEKIAGILAKTWKKMSPGGRSLAIDLAGRLPVRLQSLLCRLPGSA